MKPPKAVNEIITQVGALTHREQEVVVLVCDGLSNKIIAQKLGVGEGTVKTHLHAIFRKLGFRHRSELVIALTNLRLP